MGGIGIDALNNTHDDGWIAVVGQLKRDHSRLPLPYASAVTAAGGSVKVLSTFSILSNEPVPQGLEVRADLDPTDASVLEGAWGVLLPGGGDIDPEWYGQRAHPKTTRVSHRRDRFELNLLDYALERDMPVLAICHGMQLLNVHFGGQLVQHLPDRPETLDHDAGMPSERAVHGLEIKRGSVLATTLGCESTKVNSHHHQGVAEAAAPLEEIAWSTDGVLEGVASRDHTWVVGVQWHPEAMAETSPRQAALFAAFVAQADAFGARHPAKLTA